MDRFPPNFEFCTAVEVMDIITYDEFFNDWLRDVDSGGGQNGLFSLTTQVSVNTVPPVIKGNHSIVNY